MFSVLTLILILLNTPSYSTYQCKLQPIGTPKPSDPKLLSGFNDNLGSDLQISYFDNAVKMASVKSFTGALRHPGGNPANYWNFTNASYVTPCNYSTYYDRCGGQENINKWPLQTFSAKNFSKGIAQDSPINPKNHTIVFDLNLLTLSGNEMLNQLDALKVDYGCCLSANYFELGNEYYINKFYNWTFPNSTVYMKKALPLINKIRSDFADVNPKIAAVSKRSFDLNDSWNVGVAKYKSYYDAVTIHDYSLGPKMVNDLPPMDQISFISIYGQSVIPQYIQYVKTLFGESKKIWMTEYNLGLNSNAFNSSIMESVIHSMFTLSYISSSICNSDVMELLMYHAWNTANYGSNGQFMPLFLFYNQKDDVDDMQFGVMAQIYAHLNWIAMIRNDQMHCLSAENDNNCPVLNVNVADKTDLKCLFGIAFTNSTDANTFGFFVVNACEFDIDFVLDSNENSDDDEKKENQDQSDDIILEYWIYLWDQQGDYIKFGDCSSNKQLWECGPVKPEYKTMNVSKRGTALNITLPPLSLTLAVTQ